MNLAMVIFLGGAVVVAWIYFWSRQRVTVSQTMDIDAMMDSVPGASQRDALLVSHEHGRLLYMNHQARQMLNVNGGSPHLEQLAQQAQPTQAFLALFADEGQASFQVGRRWVEASSHRIPAGTETRTVVVLRELASNTSNPDVLDMNRAMSIINEIGETINVTLGLEQTLQTMLTIIGQAVPFDAGEINLWQETEQALYQRGWVGDGMYLVSLMEQGGRYELGEGLSGWIAQYRQPLVVDSRTQDTISPKLQDNPYESFVGTPILLGEQFIGTLELASAQAGAFTPGHMALLQAVSKSIAVTIYNTQVYADQIQRINDIAGLQKTVDIRQAQSQGVEAVYRSLNERIAELIDADMCGILLYDRDREGLAIQLPVHGLPEALVRSVFIPLVKDSPQYDIWTRQPYWISNDVIDEPLVEALGLYPVVSLAGIVNTAWIPLEVGGERMGVIAVSNKRAPGGYSNRDVQNLTVLAAQASIVIENVRLYERGRRMDTELVGLQEITNAIGALSHETEFYGEITERIARLMDVEMVGILLYDEMANALMPRRPFYGVSDTAIAEYTIPLPSESVMRELWEEESFWYSNRVQADTLVFVSGLDKIAERIGVEKTMIAVLQASGRRIGVVQISNKNSGEDFTDGDARLLMIFATQTAAIVENARLFQEAQRSAEQAQGLRRVAELAGNVLTTQETFAPVLSEISQLMQCELVFINVLDQQKGSLVTYPRWVYGAELIEPIFQDIYSPGFEYSVAVSQQAFYTNDIVSDPHVMPGYQQIAERMNIRNGMLVPLVFGDRTLGEMGVANRRNKVFSDEDLEVMTVIAAQAAAALDRLLLYEATGENLNRRMEELDAISRVSNELTVTLDLDQVLLVIREESIEATGAEGCTITLLEETAAWPAPDQPRIRKQIGDDALAEKRDLSDIEVEAIVRATEPVLITDYEFSTLEPHLPRIRSALAVPVSYLDEIVGVVHLYHSDPGAFDDRAAAFMMTMAVKASLGYGNHMRYQAQLERSERLRQRVEQMNRIFDLSHMVQTNVDPVYTLDMIAYSVQQSVGFDTVVMLLKDGATGLLHRVAQVGFPLDAFNESRRHTISEDQVQALLQPEFRISESYFFPVERVNEWYNANLAALHVTYEGNRTLAGGGTNAWHDGDLFVVRLQGPSGDLIGLMLLDRPHNNQRPDRGTVAVLEIFANQAASTIENTRLILESRTNAEQEARLNEMLEAISSTLDIEQIVRLLAQFARRIVAYRRITVALRSTENVGFEVLRVLAGDADESLEVLRETQLTLGSTALSQAMLDEGDHLYRAGDADDPPYEDLKSWRAAGEVSSLFVPLMTGGETLGVVHIGASEAQAAALEENRGALRRMAQLVASSIQNARLFNQAVDLRVLNESVVESIQQGIVVLDNERRVISVNTFMMEQFGWDRGALNRDLFEYRPGLSPVIRDDLTAVLEKGVPQEKLNQTIVTADNRQLIGNFYLYPRRFGLSVRGVVILVEDITERSRLEQAIEARAHQLAALTEVSSRITASLERDEVVQLAIGEMGWLVPHDKMSLWRRHGSYLVLEGITGENVAMIRTRDLRFMFSEYPVVQQVVDTQRVRATTGEIALPEILGMNENVESWMGVPLVNQGHVVGMIMLTADHADAYLSTSDQNIAFAFASQVAIALANADLFEQTFDRTNELGTLLEASQATSLTTDLDTVLRTVVELMFSALEMDNCTIMMWVEVDNYLEVQLDMNRMGQADNVLARGSVINLDEHPAKLRALRDRDVIVIMRDAEDNPYPEEVERLASVGEAARLLVPLVVGEESRGLIQLGTRSSDVVTQQKVRLARALGSQVAVAIENARLSAETIAHFEESLIINDLSRAISSTLDLEDMLSIVREQVPNVTGVGELYMALYDAKADRITFPLAVRRGEDYYIPPRQLGKDEVSYIIQHRRPLNLGADYYTPEELRLSLGITEGETDAKSYLGVPLIAGDEVFGVLAVRDTERTRAFAINEQRILTTVGSQLGAAIQNARLFEQVSTFAEKLESEVTERTRELEDERDRIDTLYQITSELARTLDMESLMPRALGMVAKAVSAQDGVIMQLDPITDRLYSAAHLDPSSLEPNPNGDYPVHPAENIARYIIAEDEHVLMINDLHSEPYWDPTNTKMAPWRSALAVLLETNDELLGVMAFLSRRKDAFMESHLRLMVAAANQVASAINNAELYKMIREQAERLGMLLKTEQEEADKNKAILEGIADGVVLADKTGTIIVFNSAAERILETPRTQAIGRGFGEIMVKYGEQAETWAAALDQATSSPDTEGLGEFIDERVRLGERTVSVHLSPVYTENRLLGTVSVFRDITREVEAERSKSEFVANVSHEFRTPLTSIKGYNDLLLMGAFGVLDDKQQEMLQTIKDNVARLTTLVEDVLNISKIDSGKDSLTIETVDINDLVRQVIDNLRTRPQHQSKELSIRFLPDASLPAVEADRDKLIHAISNVLDNAFNYTLSGGTIEIKTLAYEDNGGVEIQVADSGVGIPEDFRDRIWNRFERHEDTALTLDVFGTGLGLPIVKELVEMHGGGVRFESQVGVGTTFFVSLPLTQPTYLPRAVVE